MQNFNRKYLKFICLTVIVSILINIVNFPVSAQDISLTAQSACIVEHYTNTVILNKNADAVLPMASTTKIATAVTVLENEKNLDRKVKISSTASGVEGSSMYLKAGEEISIRDLLYGLMLVSGNDAATALSETVLSSRDEFIKAMNNICSQLGLRNTHFKNPSGLPEEGHCTTAVELARLTSYALTFPEFEAITSCKEHRVKETNLSSVRLLQNHNKLLRISEDCVGGKTGFTKTAGRCLVSVARRDGATVVAVTLNAPDDWNDHQKMYEYAFSAVKVQPSEKCNKATFDIDVIGGTKNKTTLYTDGTINAVWINGKENAPQITAYTDNFIYAPIAEKTVCGKVIASYNGKTISENELISYENIPQSPPVPINRKYLNRIKRILGEI